MSDENIEILKNEWTVPIDSIANLSVKQIIEVRNQLEEAETPHFSFEREIERKLKKLLFTKTHMSFSEFQDLWMYLEELLDLAQGNWLIRLILDNTDFRNATKNVRSEVGDSKEMIGILQKINVHYQNQKISIPPSASLNPDDVIKGVKMIKAREKTETTYPALENGVIDKIIFVRIAEGDSDAGLWIYKLLNTSVEEVMGHYHEYKVERAQLKEKYRNELCSNEALKNYRNEYFSRLDKFFIEFNNLKKAKSTYRAKIKTFCNEKADLEGKTMEQEALLAQYESMKKELDTQLEDTTEELSRVMAKNDKMRAYIDKITAQLQSLLFENAKIKQENAQLKEDMEDMKSDMQIAKERTKELEDKPETEYTIRILSKFVQTTSKHLKELAMFAADFKNSSDETINMFEHTICELFSDMKNVGVHILGDVGEIVKFDPQLHELLGGVTQSEDELVIIEIPGWQVSDLKLKIETVEKATVRKMEAKDNG